MHRRATVSLSLVALTIAACGRLPVEFREPVPASELPRMERQLGVRILGFQSRHPGIDTALTIGGGVDPGQSLEEALDDTHRATLRWAAHRRQPPDEGGTRQRSREDLDAQIAHFERHGLLIYLVYVEGPLDALRARTHPLVARSQGARHGGGSPRGSAGPYDSRVFRRKPPDPRSLSESWSVLQGIREGRPLIARFNSGVRDGAGHPNYPIQMGVAIPLKSPDTNGLPDADEAEQLNAVEDELVSLAGDRALLVGVITTAGMREFVLYTGTGDWIPQFHKDLQARIDHHEVQMMAQQDPEWQTYKAFVGDKDKKAN